MNSHPEQTLSIAAEPSAAHHLTPDQLDDHLIGDLAPTPAAHLAACSLCAERVALARSPLSSFQQVSTAWSERRSATLPMPIPSERPSWQRHTAWATATLSMALGFAFINATHQFSILNTPQPAPIASTSAQLTPIPQPRVATAAPASFSRAPRAVQIAADNHMLQAIDASLAPSADSPEVLGLQSAAAPSPGPPASLQD